MNILVAVEELRFGGAQTFALRFAQALHEAGHNVWLYSMYANLTEAELVHRLAPNVPVLAYKPMLPVVDKFMQRADGWLERRQRHRSLRRQAVKAHLRRMLRQHRIEVVSSNTFKSDELMAEVLETNFPAVPLVVTMHGDYEQFWEFYQAGKQYVLPNYPARLQRTLARVTAVAYLADQNLRVLEPAITPATQTAHLTRRRIYNGMEGRYSSERARFSRAALGIEPSAFVVGMVARGVPEKGWEPLIVAYQQLKAGSVRPTHLILVGSSQFLSSLQEKYRADTTIHFLGFVNNPVDCVDVFDVGVLASSLRESLPNSIAEYLFCGKSVISTDIGEIQRMLTTDEGQEAGLLISFPEHGLANAQELYQAMYRYATNEPMLKQHQQFARLAFAKFNMARCVQAYTDLYQSSRLQMQQAGQNQSFLLK